MVERKTPFRGKREYVTFGDGFPGFGETDELKAARWNADLFEKAPVSEPENDPVAYTGDEDFPTRGRYSGVGVIVDEGADFDPEPALCDGTKAAAVCGNRAQVAPAKGAEPAACASNPEPAVPASNSGRAASANKPKPAASVEAKLDLSLFRELYRSRDGRLVFFEHCATGHLAAVDASKLV
ncbi:hypothetical protein [uncultured Ellagibacter sp.]|uniref:hypothetical protein n=1 Tax=uncultured Ellagibacter sp. TaxID=2137580 RepID=UPI002623B257|nr:hypothetical protein [uncultured Ellagibacter sp.]